MRSACPVDPVRSVRPIGWLLVVLKGWSVRESTSRYETYHHSALLFRQKGKQLAQLSLNQLSLSLELKDVLCHFPYLTDHGVSQYIYLI